MTGAGAREEGFRPAYLAAAAAGILRQRVEEARRRLACCELCPRRCRVDRLAGRTGVCRTGERAVVASCRAHFGEEAPLVGRGGSGTIFFTHCSLGCHFCQNWDISHDGVGRDCPDEELAAIMLALQDRGCHNINLVTPTHVVPQILGAVELAAGRGPRLPLVYNTGGYDLVETLRLLDGIVDIYLPDLKFLDPAVAAVSCQAPDYPEAARQAVREMHRQVGGLVVGADGLARRGLLVRHLVLPGGLAGTREVMRFLAREISGDTYVNLMFQYHPAGEAGGDPVWGRRPTMEEFAAAVRETAEEGISRLDEGAARLVF